uniref:Transposase n=1 Tax=Eubacterium cellulosolvens (strain ATCC 43171 / JCM 9499 / 6) TaxID=633697 RepID=I5AS44_EUBC6
MSGANDIQLRELKDTILQLNKTISTQNTLILSLQKSIDESNARVSEKDQVIANLQAQLEYLKTKLFGSTSEVRKNVCPGQLSIFDTEDDAEKDAVPVESEFIEVKSHNRSRKPKATYDEIFENIKTTQVMVDELPQDERICPECGSLMEPVGKKTIRTEIVYHKASLERIEYVANSYRCPNAYKEAETPFLHDQCKPALIEGSYVSSGLAAHVMYYKYVLACPLYRQEQDFLHLGAKISRSTMAKWIITSSQKYLVHMYEFLHRKLCECQFLMADETPIQVLKEPERRPQSKSYVWVFRTGEDQGIPIVLFHYTPTRKGANAAEFLSNATEGYFLMTDGYKGYNKVPDANRCACWAHIRRYWLKAIPKGHEQDHTHPAVQGLLYCDKLFRYERQYKEKGLSVKQIYKRRLKDQEPVIDAFLSWVDGLTPKTGDSIIKAINYTNGCRPYLKNYLKNGACSLSNNLSENAIRPIVMGRKNWLFSDTQDGADASMVIYSLIETAKENGINPEKYLEYLLENRLSAEMSDEELERFAPWDESTREQCAV